MFVEPGKTYVRRLHAVSGERDALALRLRLERALAGADLHPPGLPPAAILCVRRLSDRRAHALLWTARGAHALNDWERAVTAAIEQLARRAASPARGAVPANAEAVIFKDQAELLACLAADWCEEAAPARWWWQSLFGGRDAAAATLSAWLAAPEHVPAALGRLADGGKLAPFLRALGEGPARALRRKVTERFGLSELQAALEAPAARGAAAKTDEGRGLDEQARPAQAAAPWEAYAPELRRQGLSGEQGSLAGVGLMLLRAPSRVRAASFAGLVESWRIGADVSAPRAPAARQTVSGGTAGQGGRDAEAGRAADARGDERAGLDARASDIPTPRLPEEGAETREPLSRQLSPARPTPSPSQEDEGGGGRDAVAGGETEARGLLRPATRDGGAQHESPAETSKGSSSESAGEEEVFAPPVVYEARVRTDFGGLFYLVNLGLFLNLYGDFTTPRQPGLALPLWDFLALLGRQLCGARVTADPIWPLLAGLAGRDPEEEPGRDFEPPGEWRLPADWLAPFKELGAWEWAADAGRLRVRHPAGFLVLDVARGGDGLTAEEALVKELEPYAEVSRFTLRRVSDEEFAEEDAAEEGFAGGGGAACRRWLSRLAPYVSARLCRALGVGEAGAAARLVCEHAARVSVTETRLDVTFELARLPFEVRLSGLDRNPGWVPAAGRYVAFHYD